MIFVFRGKKKKGGKRANFKVKGGSKRDRQGRKTVQLKRYNGEKTGNRWEGERRGSRDSSF